MKKSFLLLFMLWMMISMAYGEDITVSLPDEFIIVDGEQIDNRALTYPVLIHDNEPYLPLTWAWSKALGLTLGYGDNQALIVVSYNDFREVPEKLKGSDLKVGKSYKASPVTYDVRINGQLISKDLMFNFNNITYIPLRHEFVSEYFGWGVEGLTIDTQPKIIIGNKAYTRHVELREGYQDFALATWTTYTQLLGSNHTERVKEHYLLQYDTNEIIFEETPEIVHLPYKMGELKLTSYDKFTYSKYSIFRNGIEILDLRDDFRDQEGIGDLTVKMYDNDHQTLYILRVRVSSNGQEVPPPYTVFYDYVLTERGGKLKTYDSWPKGQVINRVYGIGEGFYLASDLDKTNGGKYYIDTGLVGHIDDKRQLTLLKHQYGSWQNMKVLGMDEANNLYIYGTWGETEPYEIRKRSRVRVLNDGFFKYTPDCQWIKVGDFMSYIDSLITPNGQIYLTMPWSSKVYHLQSETFIQPKGFDF